MTDTLKRRLLKGNPQTRRGHWTHKLFVKHAELFLPAMDEYKKAVTPDIDGLCRIFTSLGVSPGSKILDLMSGVGRYSVNLAKRGYEVVGIDMSPLFRRRAMSWAKKEKLDKRKIRLYHGDSRRAVPLLRRNGESGFKVITVMGTSIGYHGETEDARMLEDVRRVAAPRCLLVIETVNRDFLVKNFEQRGVAKMVDSVELHENRKLNLASSSMENVWTFYRKGRDNSLKVLAEIPLTHRVYSLHELKGLIDRAGWKFVSSYGSLSSLTPVTFDSRHITIIGRKSSSDGRTSSVSLKEAVVSKD